jgi:predicted phosphodiesterase
MRYAIVSDVHANLQAWKAVLLDIRSFKFDRIICLGDIVGYGPNPAEVLQSVHAHVHHIVLGNHDAAVCDKMDGSLFNDHARAILFWTRRHLNPAAVRFLRSLPLALDGRSFRCTHGDFADPAAFNYVIDAADALPSWAAVDHPLLFVGHTHRPAIFLMGASGTPHVVAPQDFELEEGKRFLVNVPSVGQPRDGRAMAGYCIFDEDARSVRWRSIPFDLDAYREAVERAGIPADASYFLRHDPLKGAPPLRELLSFSPPTTPELTVQDAVEVQDLTVLRRRVSRWRALAAVGLCAAVAAVAVSGAWWRHSRRGLEIPGSGMTPLAALSVPAGQNLLAAPPAPVAAGEPIPGWTVRLGNRHCQSVRVEGADGEGTRFVLRSDTARDEIRIGSVPIAVKPHMGFGLDSLVLKSDGFSGTLAAVVSVRRTVDGREETADQFRVKEPSIARKEGWKEIRQSFDTPDGATFLTVQLRGRFTGEVSVRDLALVRKE